MTLSPLQLAAIVSAGVPGIYPVGAEPVREDSDDFDSAIIADSTGRRWRVRAPRRPDASMRLEAEHLILQSFSPGLRARLPFAVPTVAGTVPYAGGNVFVYTHIPGTIYDVDQLAELSRREVAANRPSLASIIAKDIATLHVMPEDIIYEADLPSYSSEQIRLRKNAELERAAATGKVPADLLAHWRTVLSPGPMWQFRPRVVHGDMGAENLVLHVTPDGAHRGGHRLVRCARGRPRAGLRLAVLLPGHRLHRRGNRGVPPADASAARRLPGAARELLR